MNHWIKFAMSENFLHDYFCGGRHWIWIFTSSLTALNATVMLITEFKVFMIFYRTWS